jgi:CHAT domain-containing protein/tetratricopeptide (TPR) repeat protein
LLSTGNTEKDGPTSTDALADSRAHLQACAACQKRRQDFETVSQTLAALTVRQRTDRKQECPPEGVWREIAATLMPAEEAKKHLVHAAQCDHCGPLLRETAELFGPGISSQEDPMISGLASAQPEWQKTMAQRMSRLARPPEQPAEPAGWRRWFSLPRLIPVTAIVAAAIAGFVFWTQRQSGVSRTNELLARAYTEQRTLELRIPGAGYGPVRVERGSERSRLNRPEDLLRAEAEIASGLAAHPNDPAWLQAKARADLLDGNYEEARQSLERALALRPDSPSLLTDLGTAYFQRGESENRPADFGAAIEYFGRALRQAPDDPVALFNRAVASGKLFLYTQEIADWEHYLRVDPNGEWSEEARRRLQEVRERVEKHQQAVAESLLSPEEFARVAGDPARAEKLDQRIEDYLRVGLIEWLPAAFPEGAVSAAQSRDSARAGLMALARNLSEKHADRWMQDFLAGPQSPTGVTALVRSLRANEAGEPSVAGKFAAQAQQEFSRVGNQPGRIRAEMEQVYAEQRSAESVRCLRSLRRVWTDLAGKRYSWLTGQSYLEAVSCSDMSEDIDTAMTNAPLAIAATSDSGYGTLRLRSLSFAAYILLEKHRGDEAWGLTLEGLRKYWSGPYPAGRAYELYAIWADDSELHSHEYLARSLWLDATAAVAASGNRSVEAMARYRLAATSLATGDSAAAGEQFRRADALFSKLPETPDTLTYIADSSVALAGLEASGGDIAAASDALDRAERILPRVSDYHIFLDFHRTRGMIYLKQGNYSQADRSFSQATRIGEFGVEHFASELDRARWGRDTGLVYRGLLETWVAQHRGPQDTLELWEWYRALPLRDQHPSATAAALAKTDFSEPDSLPVSVQPPSLSTIQKQLQNQTVLAYAALSNGLQIWVLDDQNVSQAWVPVSHDRLADLSKRFVAECGDPGSNTNALQRDSRQLYEWLVQPVESRLQNGRTLVLELDDAVAQLPIQALMDAQGRYLASRFAVSLSPGLWQTQRLRRGEVISASDRALVVSVPAAPEKLSASLPPLPSADQEAAAVAARFRSATELTGPQASLQEIEKFLPEAKVFHFAGHSLAMGGREGLLVAQGDRSEGDALPLLDAAALTSTVPKQCELAVLSACRTALEGYEGTGQDGMVEALLRNGVPHVLATRWNIDSAVSANFINAFYSKLLTGISVTQAAQGAAVETMRRSGSSHPYYWAGFGVFGRE